MASSFLPSFFCLSLWQLPLSFVKVIFECSFTYGKLFEETPIEKKEDSNLVILRATGSIHQVLSRQENFRRGWLEMSEKTFHRETTIALATSLLVIYGSSWTIPLSLDGWVKVLCRYRNWYFSCGFRHIQTHSEY